MNEDTAPPTVDANRPGEVLRTLLAAHRPSTELEAADLARVLALLDTEPDPWSRAVPLHVTASALIVHPASARVLLRWHARQQAWLHVGGHGDPGEDDPLRIAHRESWEETRLDDLAPWPDGRLLHLAVVPVPPSATEPAHEHADLRFVLATGDPDAARPENPTAALRWVSVAEAHQLTDRPSLHETLARVSRLFG